MLYRSDVVNVVFKAKIYARVVYIDDDDDNDTKT